MNLLTRLFGSRKDAAPQQADPVAEELFQIRLLLIEMRNMQAMHIYDCGDIPLDADDRLDVLLRRAQIRAQAVRLGSQTISDVLKQREPPQ